MPTFLRSDQVTIHVLTLPVTGFQATLGGSSWSTLEGGDLESEDTKIRPGGMVPQINLGGPTTRTDATVTRPYTKELHPFVTPLELVAGNGAMSITYRMMDADRIARGKTTTLSGILKSVTRPNFDSNSAGATMLGLVMGCDVASSTA